MQTTIVGNPESALSVQGPSRDLTICLKVTEMVQYIIDLTRIYRYVVVKIQAMTVYIQSIIGPSSTE